MLVKKIIYLDTSIKVCCVKNTTAEQEKLLPELVQHVFFYYSIGLVNNPTSRVKETFKIERKDIRFGEKCLIFSCSLDGLLKPEECEFTIHSITFFLRDQPRYKAQFDKTVAFRHMDSDPAIFENLMKKNKSFTRKTPDTPSSICKTTSSDTSKISLHEIKHFMNSYEKFKTRIQDSEFKDLLSNKPSAIDFNLKSFGISLLCKLLLLIKSVNELVDNDFQKDLHEFLQSQIINQLETEVSA
jgi:hypothetical protein